jgi:hypothetical protein
MTLFGPRLHDLSLDDLQAFLEGADSEPLLWEAKGTALDPHAVRKEVCGFANGRQPAFLILGAAKDEGTWSLSGLDFGGDPPAWISDVISDGLRPRPMIDVRSIEVSAGKHVAVVEVPPVAIAPCICRGTVYERVSGRTVAVKEPLRLADLYGRGDVARSQTRMASTDLARELFRDPGLPGSSDPWPRVAVAVAATGLPPDVGAVLFSRQYESDLDAVIKRAFTANRALTPEAYGPTFQAGFEQSNRFVDCVDTHGHTCPLYWHVRAIWNGAVGVYATWEIDSVFPEHVAETLIQPAWSAAAALVERLGGFGPTHTQILVEGKAALSGRDGSPMGVIGLERGPTEMTASSSEFASVYRELRRATGLPIYESDEAAEPVADLDRQD